MTRPKKGGGGRHTPKKGASPSDIPAFGASDLADLAAVPNFPRLDPNEFEQAIIDSSVDITGMDPDDLDLEALGLDDTDPIEIIMARMTQALDEGPGAFVEEVAGAAWMIHDAASESERPDALETLAGFEGVGPNVMTGLAVLGMTAPVRSAAALKAAPHRGEVSPWLQRLDQAKVTAASIGTYEPDDEVEVLLEITIPEMNPFVVAIERSKVVHELITQVSTLLEPLQHLADDVNSDDAINLKIEMVDLQRAADELAITVIPTIEWATDDETGGLPVDNGVETVLPLVRWATSLLPESSVEPFFGFEGEQRDEAISIYVERSDSDLSAEHLARVGFALDFSVEREVFRWTPQRLVNMFQRAAEFVPDPLELVGALREFLPFAAQQHGSSQELLAHNLAVLDSVEEHADELFGSAQ